MYLIFNTAATDLPRTDVEFGHPLQPHLLHFSGLILDRQGNEVERISTLLMPSPAARVSPFSAQEAARLLNQARLRGGNACNLSNWFNEKARLADLIVAHDVALHLRVMATLAVRCDGRALIPKTARYCTMEHGARVMRMQKGTRNNSGQRFHPEEPSLSVFHEHLFGEPVKGPDIQIAQLEACAQIFRYMTGLPPA